MGQQRQCLNGGAGWFARNAEAAISTCGDRDAAADGHVLFALGARSAIQMIGAAIISLGEAHQLALRIWEATRARDLAEPSCQLPIMRATATSLDRPSSEQRLDPDKDERGTGERREQRGLGRSRRVGSRAS
jgi:hypothetical protein